MSLRHGILGFLQYGDQTGYDLGKAFQSSVDYFWHASISQIYRELNWLEAHELVISEMIVQTDKPNRKLYHCTEKGSQAFIQWLGSAEDHGPLNLRSAFLMRVFFSGERPVEQTIEMLKQFEAQCTDALQFAPRWQESAAHYQTLVPDAQKVQYWLYAGDFGRRYLEMCIGWARDTQKALSEKQGVTP